MEHHAYPRNITLTYIPQQGKLLLNKLIAGPYAGLWSFEVEYFGL